MKVRNPNSDEVSLVFDAISNKINVDILTEQQAGKHWPTIQSMTQRFGMSEVNINNPDELNLFKKTGWIEYRIFISPEINAFAVRNNDLQYLGFYFGLLFMVRDSFFALFSTPDFLPDIGDSKKERNNIVDFRNNYIENLSSSKYFRLVPKCEERQKWADRMTQIALNFVYAHESTHLAHCHQDYLAQLFGINELFEFPLARMSSEFSFDQRALELDADLGGMRFTIAYVSGMNSKWKENEYLPYNMYLIWIFAIKTLFKILDPNNDYLDDETASHPNNFVRSTHLIYNSLPQAIDSKLIKNIEEGVTFLDKSAELQNQIFNKIGFVPKDKGTLESNQELINKYSARCEFLLNNELQEHIERRRNKVQSDYSWLLHQRER